jgi:hypothetical protein
MKACRSRLDNREGRVAGKPRVSKRNVRLKLKGHVGNGRLFIGGWKTENKLSAVN